MMKLWNLQKKNHNIAKNKTISIFFFFLTTTPTLTNSFFISTYHGKNQCPAIYTYQNGYQSINQRQYAIPQGNNISMYTSESFTDEDDEYEGVWTTPENDKEQRERKRMEQGEKSRKELIEEMLQEDEKEWIRARRQKVKERKQEYKALSKREEKGERFCICSSKCEICSYILNMYTLDIYQLIYKSHMCIRTISLHSKHFAHFKIYMNSSKSFLCAFLIENLTTAKLAEKVGVSLTLLEPPDDFDSDSNPIQLNLPTQKRNGWFDEIDKELDRELDEDDEPVVVDGKVIEKSSQEKKKIAKKAGILVGSAGGWSLEVFPGDFVVHRYAKCAEISFYIF